ncbi:MAG: hypothetical protein LLG06_17020 [Desulfobacteraceae bacterium]|nr:hypothetical protein [Desulfobacteraceae bacterium]
MSAAEQHMQGSEKIVGLSPTLFPAAQIAVALGKTKRAVQLSLSDIPPSGQVIVRGQPAAAWSVPALPPRMRTDLEAEATRRGFRDAGHLLSSPPVLWMPSIPLNEIAPKYTERASNLQRALADTLSRLNDLDISSDEIERLGIEDYRRVFGHTISGRHWRRLLDRTRERDKGAEDWIRPEIYLDENPARKSLAPLPLNPAVHDYRDLQELISGFAKPLQPTPPEREYFWIHVLERLDGDVAGGKTLCRAKKALLAFLAAKAPFLADNPRRLKWTFDRKYRKWIETGRSLEAVKDQRHQNSGRYRAPDLTEDDRKLIIGTAVTKCGGRIAQAWRYLIRAGQLSQAILDHYSRNPTSKSYVPKTVIEAVKYDIDMVEDIHHGPRRARLNGAYVECDPTSECSGDVYSGDDATFGIYYHDNTEQGLQIVRSQVLLMIDCRSIYILGFVLTGTAAYSAFHIRNLITHVHDSYGLPRRAFLFENGSWRARLVTGRKDEVDWTGTELGLRGLGLKFRHARLARAKIIERVMGLTQDLMDGEPGYCGRDERRDGFERMEQHKRMALSGKVPASEYFMSREEWCQRLEQVFNQYNDEIQQGKYLDGLSPREGFEKFHHGEGALRLTGNTRYLLANHKMKVLVGRNGISFRFGKQTYTYKNERTGALKGKPVVAWFNPEFPDLLSVSDENMRDVFTVERALPIPPTSATDEQLAEALAQNAQHDAYSKALYRSIKPRFSDRFMQRMFQPVVVDEKTAAAGQQMLEQREKIVLESQRQVRQESAIRQKARRLGFSDDTLARDPVRQQRGLDLNDVAERLHAEEVRSGNLGNEGAIL